MFSPNKQHTMWLWPSPTTAAVFLSVPACSCRFRCAPVEKKIEPVWTSSSKTSSNQQVVFQDCHVFGEIESCIECRRTPSQPIAFKEAGQRGCRPFPQSSTRNAETDREKKSHHYANPSNGGGPGRWSLFGKWKERLQASYLAQLKGEETKVVSNVSFTYIEVTEDTADAI